MSAGEVLEVTLSPRQTTRAKIREETQEKSITPIDLYFTYPTQHKCSDGHKLIKSKVSYGTLFTGHSKSVCHHLNPVNAIAKAYFT